MISSTSTGDVSREVLNILFPAAKDMVVDNNSPPLIHEVTGDALNQTPSTTAGKLFPELPRRTGMSGATLRNFRSGSQRFFLFERIRTAAGLFYLENEPPESRLFLLAGGKVPGISGQLQQTRLFLPVIDDRLSRSHYPTQSFQIRNQDNSLVGDRCYSQEKESGIAARDRGFLVFFGGGSDAEALVRSVARRARWRPADAQQTTIRSGATPATDF